MEKLREIKFYQSYFLEYYKAQSEKVQEKIDFILQVLETQHFVSDKYVKHITNSNSIYEIRISIGSNEYRILFFFESGDLISGGKIIVLGNGFMKKDTKDYKKAVQLAEAIKDAYFEEQAEKDKAKAENKNIDNT